MEKYLPDIYQDSIYTINYEKLLEQGIKCLLFDLDNTLVPYNIKEYNDTIKELFNKLKSLGFTIIIFSNSPKNRVKNFKGDLEVEYKSCAKKPSCRSFEEIMINYKFSENEIAIVGDQLLTDILGGNKSGVTTILVNPVDSYDPIWTKFSRFIEKRIMQKLRDRDLFVKGRFYE